MKKANFVSHYPLTTPWYRVSDDAATISLATASKEVPERRQTLSFLAPHPTTQNWLDTQAARLPFTKRKKKMKPRWCVCVCVCVCVVVSLPLYVRRLKKFERGERRRRRDRKLKWNAIANEYPNRFFRSWKSESFFRVCETGNEIST